MMRKLCVASCLQIVLTFAGAVPVQAQPAEMTASQFYTEYRAAFDKAETVEDIIQYMSASRRKQIESTPADERAMMFDMMKTLGVLSDLKIAKETRTAGGATLSVDALDSDKAKTTGTITLVKENGAWKIEKERFSSSSR
jgi:hypothetical protein